MIPFRLLEQRSIQAALDFANLGPVPSVDAIYEIFMPAAGMSGAAHFKAIPDADIGAFVDDKAELTDWLDRLSTWQRQTTKERLRVHSEIQKRLGPTVEGKAFWRLTDGRLEAYVQPVLTGVQACYAFAAALLADEEAKRWKRLHRCALPECGKWFWESTVRGGPVRKFCSDQHAAKLRKIKLARKHK